MKKPLILLKSAGSDGRYLAENLKVLRPEAKSLRTVYGARWVAQSVREGVDGMKGRDVLVAFFDYESGLLLPVRRGSVRDAVLHEGFLRLDLALGSFVRCGKDLDAEDVLRLGEEGFDARDRKPKDGMGRHAFVFDAPEAWAERLEGLGEDHSLMGWRSLAQRLSESKPYRACRFLCLEPDFGRGGAFPGNGRRLPQGSKEAPMRLSCEGFSETGGDTLAVRFVAYRGVACVWSETVEVRPGESLDVAVPLGTGSGRGKEPLAVEAFDLSESVPANRCHLEFPPPEEVAAEPPVPEKEKQARLEAVLAHVRPSGPEQQKVCEQIVSGVLAHGKAEPWLVDQLIDWGMPKQALEIVRQMPEVCGPAGHPQFAQWMNALREYDHPGRDVLLRRAFERLLKGSASEELLRAWLAALEGLDAESFWRACPLHRAWGKEGRDPLEVPFVMHLVEAGDVWERFIDLLVRMGPSPPDERRFVAGILYLEGRDEAAIDLEAEAAAEGADWVDWPRFLAGCPWRRLWELLARLPSRPDVYAAVKKRYSAWKGRMFHPDVDFDADLLHWLYGAAGECAPNEITVWLSELAELAAGNLDVLLYGWVVARREALEGCPEALKALERTAEALEEERIPKEIERLRGIFKGKRLLVLGGRGKPFWIEILEKQLGLHVTHKASEPSQHFSMDDIPNGFDLCMVLRWAHHDAWRCANARLGRENVTYLYSCGKRGAFAALRRFAEEEEG